MRRARVAIVGAGAAGIACAAALRSAGVSVSLYDKGRAPGGRLARRVLRDGPDGAAIDHGAPAAHDGGHGDAAALLATIADPAPSFGAGAYRRDGGAAGLVQALLASAAGDGPALRIAQGVEIAALARGPEDYALRDADGGLHGPFDAVAVAVPAAQAAALIGSQAPAAEVQATYRPVSTAILFYDGGGEAAEETRPDGAAGPIERAVRFAGPGWTAWALHSDLAFADANLNTAKPEIAATLRAAFDVWRGSDERPLHEAGHRWRYAQTTRPVGRAFYLSDDGALGAAGDWRLGPTVGDALMSGKALGDALAKRWG